MTAGDARDILGRQTGLHGFSPAKRRGRAVIFRNRITREEIPVCVAERRGYLVLSAVVESEDPTISGRDRRKLALAVLSANREGYLAGMRLTANDRLAVEAALLSGEVQEAELIFAASSVIAVACKGRGLLRELIG